MEEIAALRMAPWEMALMLLWFLAAQLVPCYYLFDRRLDFLDFGLPLSVQISSGGLGMVFFIVAIWLLWRSHADLGSAWSAVVEVLPGQELVTHGVYRWIRHPMYAAHLLWGLAQVLLVQNWLAGALALPVMLLLCLLRIPREEWMLVAHYGDQYRSYRARTGSIFPRWPRHI